MRYIKENLKEFEICGILKWHEKGYTGAGIKIAEIESARTDLWFFDDKLHDPFNRSKNTGYNTHGQKVLDIMHQVAPDADLYCLPSGIVWDNKTVTGSFIEQTLPYVIENRIHIVGASIGGSNRKELNEKILEAQRHGVIFTTSAGNSGEKGLTSFAKSDVWISVAAAHYLDHKDKISLASYSSRGPELDITSFSSLYVHDGRPGYEDRVFAVEGTSFSQPMVAGMLALVQQFFLEKTGQTLNQEQMLQFIYDHVVDLGEVGFDEEFGHGLFVLPDPDEIDVWKYIGKEEEPQLNKPEYIIIHHSATQQGDAETFRKAHKANGWRDIGYHYVINNGTYQPDGLIETGRSEAEDGAHCKADGMNFKSIGICLVGNFDIDKPTIAQMEALERLCRDIMARYKIPASKVLGHGEVAGANTACPGKYFDMRRFRAEVLDVEKKDYEGHWAEEYIKKAINAGYMTGYPDGSFKPDNPITRAEFARVLSFIIDKLERR